MSKKKPRYNHSIEDLSQEVSAVYQVLNTETDLAVALISTSFLDQSLASLLHRYFIETSVADKLLNPQGGALGTFGSRIDTTYCLGLINKPVYQDLLVVANIRNAFAHNHLLTDFQTPEITDLCGSLRYPSIIDKEMEIQKTFIGDANPLASVSLTPRSRFTITTILIGQQILVQALSIKHKQENTAFVQGVNSLSKSGK